MAKLILGDGVKIRTTERLKEYWDYKDGTLLDWLLHDCGAEAELTGPVKALATVTDTKELAKRLCEIFGMPFDETAFAELEELNELKAREDKLRKFTAKDEVLENIDKVAFDQKELNELLDKGEKTIYLVSNKFYIDLEEENITYKGVGDVIAVIRSDEVVDLNALGIEFIDIAFDEKYTAIEKATTPKILQSENPISGIVDRMIQVTEKCWIEYKNELPDAKLYFDNTDEAATKLIESAIKSYANKSPNVKLERNDFVALFYSSLHQSDDGLLNLLICKEGFYFENEIKQEVKPFIKSVFGETFSSDKSTFKNSFIKWSDIIFAYYDTGYFSKSAKFFVKLIDGKDIEIAQRLNNSFLIDFTVTLINKLQDIDDDETFMVPSETAKKMISIVKECKNSAINYLDGAFYVRDNIPKKKLDSVIKMFAKNLPVNPIKRNEIIGLYLCHFKYNGFSGSKGCSLNTILLTEKGFYYNRNPLNTKDKDNMRSYFWTWNNMDYVDYKNKGTKSRIKFNFFNGGIIYILTFEADNECHEDSCTRFIVPLLTKLKNAATNN